MRGALAAVALVSAFAGVARAREPDVMSDGVYVGARIDPGVALLVGWDLDIYLREDRAWSLGPGAFASALGVGERAGMAQDLLVAADVLRFKVQMSEAGGLWRPWLVLGAGLSYARLGAQDGAVRYDREEELTAMATVGGGADLFTGGHWAVSAIAQTHVHLFGSDRLPVAWLELAVGARFGI